MLAMNGLATQVGCLLVFAGKKTDAGNPMNRIRSVVLIFGALIFTGCAEGPLWQTGHYAPWARQQWEQENQIASTLQGRKQSLNQMLQQANSDAQREQLAKHLHQIVNEEPVLLLRLHAVTLLGQVNHPSAIQPLADATSAPDSRVRIAAVQAWQRMPGNLAIPRLQEVIGSDTDVDVRLAATKALANFNEPNATQALSLALTDNNPAIQFRAMESLEKVTGKNLGADVAAWQTFLGSSNSGTTANANQPIGSTLIR